MSGRAHVAVRPRLDGRARGVEACANISERVIWVKVDFEVWKFADLLAFDVCVPPER